jgi:hypothetical protein
VFGIRLFLKDILIGEAVRAGSTWRPRQDSSQASVHQEILEEGLDFKGTLGRRGVLGSGLNSGHPNSTSPCSAFGCWCIQPCPRDDCSIKLSGNTTTTNRVRSRKPLAPTFCTSSATCLTKSSGLSLKEQTRVLPFARYDAPGKAMEGIL